MMNESDAQKVIYRDLIQPKRHVLAVPNCKALHPSGESDLLSVTPAGLVHEFEIKLSKQDFLRDFEDKKYKHRILEQGGRKVFGEDELRSKDLPNYFWFATSSRLDVDIPEYAGHAQFSCSGCEIKKDAPRLHSENITDRARKYLERGITVRHWTD